MTDEDRFAGRPRRYVLTGTPGSGKTTLLQALDDTDVEIVEESATAVIAAAQARGEAEPWTRPDFVDEIVTLQRRRQTAAGAPADGAARVQLYDRSPICCHALCVYLGYPISPVLAAEIERVRREHVYERDVFFVRNLGFCEPTAARRISFAESIAFERVHEASYRAFGYRLVEVPADRLAARADLIRMTIARLAAA